MPSLWLINQFANTPDLPGHTRQFELAAGLVEQGWSVNVFASDFNLTQRVYRRLHAPQLWANEKIAGINWCWLWVSPYRKNNWKRQLNMLSFCIHLAIRLGPAAVLGKITGEAPDVIVASSPQLPAAFTMLLIAKITAIPFILEVRDLWPQVLVDQGGKSQTSFLVRCLRWIEGQLYRNSVMVIVLAKGAENYVRHRGALATTWLPNGPDLKSFTPQPLPILREAFTVLYAGAHGEANDLENVVEAARLLEERKMKIQFRFVGDGPEKKMLIQKAFNLSNISFEDPVPKAEVAKIMSQADAILLSLRDVPLFRYGVSPNKLYDAYALGRPVITTVPGTINQEVADHKVGVTAIPGNPRVLADAIQDLAQTPRIERQAMGARATKLAQTIYSRQRVILELNSILLKAIQIQ